jgi:hypothetical protein
MERIIVFMYIEISNSYAHYGMCIYLQVHVEGKSREYREDTDGISVQR